MFSKKPKKTKPGADAGKSGKPVPEKPKTKREQIADKYQQIEDRRKAIQEELKWLENFNRNIKKQD
ncbi:MAG: hypothetical protein KJO41_04925 [Bacteroidia bacterium]|nr:hypothetical protein [Bacteroidia bacterium]MBT8278324.1 hypothetical protein [Bacteroidia bacterium]NND26130.1 hypothetical protein [Flavobacteriaceae bacterium]NNK60071.1 hypothetical protein [Flavobacteriaceae bacterium]NNL34115.1 hypothetical protein [Flavobacteriaceae bacterium]